MIFRVCLVCVYPALPRPILASVLGIPHPARATRDVALYLVRGMNAWASSCTDYASAFYKRNERFGQEDQSREFDLASYATTLSRGPHRSGLLWFENFTPQTLRNASRLKTPVRPWTCTGPPPGGRSPFPEATGHVAFHRVAFRRFIYRNQ